MEEKKVYSEEEIQRILDSAKVCTKTNVCKGCMHSGYSDDSMECTDLLMEELYDVAELEHIRRLEEHQAMLQVLGNDFSAKIKEANDQIKETKSCEKQLIDGANRDAVYINKLEGRIAELERKIYYLEEANHWLKHKGTKSDDDSDDKSETIDDMPLEEVVGSIINLCWQVIDSKRISERTLIDYLESVFNDRINRHFKEEINAVLLVKKSNG